MVHLSTSLNVNHILISLHSEKRYILNQVFHLCDRSNNLSLNVKDLGSILKEHLRILLMAIHLFRIDRLCIILLITN